MKVANQFAVLFLICMAGICLSHLCPIPLPASVIAMALLFLLLLGGVVKAASMREVSDFMLGNMSLFFVPAGAAILGHTDALRADAGALFAVCLLSMFATFVTTLVAVRATTKMLNARRTRRGGQS